ncbi:Mesogenin-1 [Acipenser ruthenus]|uniref:Mesogenin-1 n=1 Tax=Acipenser ruthenus TaxID=7906 RepID=A0A662YWR0_ACIRT|nr:mesogenin-1 [Acipenser ruthenus]RXM99988.1 Mesogenin-1 [Acipenser ruthenus]
MEHLHEGLMDLDDGLSILTSKLLAAWDWKTKDKAFEMGHELSPRSTSPASSFDSVCSSPEMMNIAGNPLTSLSHSAFQSYNNDVVAAAANHKQTNKPKMSTKRRMKASEREKMRMRNLADALHHLRDYLPPDYSQRGQPLTKIQTLKYTIQYINELSDLLRKNGEGFA